MEKVDTIWRIFSVYLLVLLFILISGSAFGQIKVNKSLGYFIEGKYNKYWNREWYDFKLGLNYTIF